MTRRRVRIALAGLALFAAGCGSNSTAPSPSPEGKWNGTWQYVSGGATVTDTVNATVTDDGATIMGSWTAQSGATGTFRFPPGATIAGTFSVAQAFFTGGVCTANSTMAGTSTSSTIDFTVAQIPTNGACAWGSDQKFSLKK